MKNRNVLRIVSMRVKLIIIIGLVLATVAACVRAQVPEPEILARFPTGWSLPTPIVQASDGNFYGATANGGSAYLGVIYRMTGAGALTTVMEFTDSTPGSAPLVADHEGNVYGTTIRSLVGAPGSVYKVDPAGVFTRLFRFDGTNGRVPYGATILLRFGGSNGRNPLGPSMCRRWFNGWRSSSWKGF